MNGNKSVLELSASIVAAYVGNNTVSSKELPDLVTGVYGSLVECGNQTADQLSSPGKPAVPANKSVFDAYLICLEDGQKFKSLKRHLRAKYDLSPDAYREKWGLPATYPMVAPEYARTRSELARKIGLGRRAKNSK